MRELSDQKELKRAKNGHYYHFGTKLTPNAIVRVPKLQVIDGDVAYWIKQGPADGTVKPFIRVEQGAGRVMQLPIIADTEMIYALFVAAITSSAEYILNANGTEVKTFLNRLQADLPVRELKMDFGTFDHRTLF